MRRIRYCIWQIFQTSSARQLPLSMRSGFLALLTSLTFFASSSSHSAEDVSISSSEPEFTATENPVEVCLLAQVLLEENLHLTVADIRESCIVQIAADSSSIGIENVSVAAASNVLTTARIFDYEAGEQRFFRPYKNNYIVLGGMKNDDNSQAFTGNKLDLKFELGMMFSLIPSSNSESGFIPLHFGYSQRSWWDISEPSAPFQEHNYNPEIFWDFSRKKSNAVPALIYLRNLFFVDRIGIEHQSNGLNSEQSRSWDRIYMEREFVFSEALSFNLKLWHILNKGPYNEDITDFLGERN